MHGVVTGTSTVTTTYIGDYLEWVSPGTALKYYYLGGKRAAMRDVNLYF